MIGQLFVGVGAVLSTACQAPFCNNWYNLESRPLIIAITSTTLPLGSSLPYLLVPLFIPDSNGSIEDIQNGTMFFTGLIACIYGIIGVLIIVLFSDHPPSKKNKIKGTKDPVSQEKNYCKLLKSVLTDSVWILSFLAMFFGGAALAQFSILNEVLNLFGYSNQKASILVVGVLFASIVATVIYGYLWMK